LQPLHLVLERGDRELSDLRAIDIGRRSRNSLKIPPRSTHASL
jgi:hypothetical protein